MNKTDETGTLFFKKCLILPLTFLRLTEFETSRGNLDGSLSLLHAATDKYPFKG